MKLLMMAASLLIPFSTPKAVHLETTEITTQGNDTKFIKTTIKVMSPLKLITAIYRGWRLNESVWTRQPNLYFLFKLIHKQLSEILKDL